MRDERVEGSAAALGALRIGVFAMWIFHVVRAPLAELAVFPADAAIPTGILRLLSASGWSGVLRAEVLGGFQSVLVVVLVLGLLGVRPYRPVALAAAVMLTLHESLIRSFSGYANHQEVPLLLTAYVLAIFPAGDGLSWPRRATASRRAPEYRAALMVVAGTLAIGYAAVGARRWSHHGFEMLFAADQFVMFYGLHHSLNHGDGTMARFLVAHPQIVSLVKWGLPVVSLLELLAPLAVASERLRLWWLLFAVCFHALIGLMIGVFFWQTSVIFALTLVDLDRLFSKRRTRR